MSVSSTVPDTITSWVASAFAMSTQTGIGVAESPAKVMLQTALDYGLGEIRQGKMF